MERHKKISLTMLNFIDLFLINFIVPHIQLSIQLISTSYNKSKDKLTLRFKNLNPGFVTKRFLYIELYYAIISNKDFIKFSPHKIFITTALTDRDLSQGNLTKHSEKNGRAEKRSWLTDQFNLHANYYYGNHTSVDHNLGLNQFLQYTKHSYINLVQNSVHNYFGFNIIELIVDVWDISELKNLKIKPASNEINSTSPRNKRLYSTQSKAGNYNAKHFTPLTPPPVAKNDSLEEKLKEVKPKRIVACDIETVKHPSGKKLLDNKVLTKYIQIPALITITFWDKNVVEQTLYFKLDYKLLKLEGLDVALKQLWKEYFTFLSNNIEVDSVIFFHGLGGFDSIFLFKGLLGFCKDIKKIGSIIDKQNKFIQITAEINKQKFIFKDSLRIFPLSLQDFCKAMGVQGKISKYNNLWNEPSILWDKNSKLYQEFIKYSLQDSLALFDALTVAQEHYLANYDVDICTIWSTSTLSLKIFRSKFLKDTIYSLNASTDMFVREGYYGGATDHYKKYGKGLYYYDVNSLYPFAMKKAMPTKHLGDHPDMRNYKLDDFFGFALAKIECTDKVRLPVLPYKSKEGKVIYPRGVWYGVYFSEILKAAVKLGYRVTLVEGKSFSKEYIFNDYIDHFYKIKENSEGSIKFLAKMNLNQLYGYFGRSQELIVTENVDKLGLIEALKSKYIEKLITITPDLYVLLMKGNINQTVYNQLPEDMKNDLKGYTAKKRAVKTHVGIAAAVTAYAQVEMMKYKTMPGYQVFYTDTDSLILDKPLPEELIGSGLGLMKNEMSKKGAKYIDEAYILGNKFYGYSYTDNTGVKKYSSVISGAERNSVSWEDLIKISNGETVRSVETTVFRRDFGSLDISIGPRSIDLRMSTNKKLIGNNYIP